MKSGKVKMLSLAVLLFLAAGCRSTETPENRDSAAAEKKTAAPGRFSDADDAPARDAAEKVVAAFAAALEAGDREKLPEPMRDKVSGPMFQRMCDSFARRRGTLRGTALVTVLDQGIVRDYLWKFTFEKSAAAASAGSAAAAVPEVRKSEVIYLVRIGILNGKPTVVGCGFQE